MDLKVTFNLFPLKFKLIWDEEGNLLSLHMGWEFSFVKEVRIFGHKKAFKFYEKFLEAFLKYWNFETSFVEVKHKLEKGTLEKKVLLKLKEIEVGKVKTYGELAEEVGIPRGYRIIGKILAKNTLPLVYPCHRVVGSKDLGGYSQGVLLKQFLLYREWHFKEREQGSLIYYTKLVSYECKHINLKNFPL